MGLLNLKDIKKSSVYITPNLPVLETKRYKFSFFSILAAVGIYSFLLIILVVAVLLFTPARNVVFFFENDKLNEQVEKVKELETKVIFLTQQLEELASTNEKLRYAMILASTDSLDSTAAIYDSLRQSKNLREGSGGSLITVFRDFIVKIIKSPDERYFIKPVDGVIVKDFQPEKGHMGVDFGVKLNTPIVAVGEGLVTFAGYTSEYGYTIMISHPNNFISIYKHCESLLCGERDRVLQGETIALSGNTGHKSSGPHLHFELWKNGTPVNPEEYLINK